MESFFNPHFCCVASVTHYQVCLKIIRELLRVGSVGTCLPHKLCLDPQHRVKGTAARLYNPRAGEAETRGPLELTNLSA